MNSMQYALVTVHRDTGSFAWPFPLRVYVDGHLVASLRPKQIQEIDVTAGEHVIAATLSINSTAPINFHLEPGDCLDFHCTTNQLPLPPLFVHAYWLLILFVLVHCLASFFPPVKKLIEADLLVEILIGLCLGMFVYFRRLHAAGALTPELYLRLK